MSETCPHCGRPLQLPDDPEDPQEQEVTRPHASKLDDPGVRQAILDAIEAGQRPEVAAAEQGIGSATWHRWMRRGKNQRDRRVRGKYRSMLEDVEQAELKGEGRYVGLVANAAIDDPRLAMQFLQVKYAKHWQQQVSVIVQSDRQQILDVLFSEFANEPAVLERFLAAVAGVRLPGGPRTVEGVASTVDALPAGPEGSAAAGPAGLDSADAAGVAPPKTP